MTCSSFPKTVFTNSGPAKSTPVLPKGYPSLNMNSGISNDGLTLYTPNANMADHSVGTRDELHESEASVFCFEKKVPLKRLA